MNDLSQDSLLREIEEDVRHDRYARLWKRWGGFVIAAVVGLVVAVAGFQAWKYRERTELEAAATRFEAATALAEQDPAAAASRLAELAADAPAGYATLAYLRRASLLRQSGDREGARAAYREVQADAVSPWRDLAVVLETEVAMEEQAAPMDAAALAAKLEPLMAADNPWRYSARELSALLDWRTGREAEARSAFTALAAEADAPPDMRERAAQFAAQIGES